MKLIVITLSILLLGCEHNNCHEEINSIPFYGYKKKCNEQIEADNKFLASMDKIHNNDRRKAAKDRIDSGWEYLYSNETKKAIMRFNQAYLLDSTYSDVYWAFGSIYFNQNNINLARKQYQKGLEYDKNNSRILTDYGTTYMSEAMTKRDIRLIETAIKLMLQSFSLDSTNQNTSYKLASCYLLKSDCDNAIKFNDICISLGGDPITDKFSRELRKRCN